MDLEDIVTTLESFMLDTGIDRNDLVVSAGAALVMYGLRENTEDIDITVDKTFGEHAQRFAVQIPQWAVRYIPANKHPSGKTVWAIGDMEIHADTLPKRAYIVSGVVCYTLEDILQQKLAMDRPKDQADILCIKRYLRNNPNYADALGRIDFNYLDA